VIGKCDLSQHEASGPPLRSFIAESSCEGTFNKYLVRECNRSRGLAKGARGSPLPLTSGSTLLEFRGFIIGVESRFEGPWELSGLLPPLFAG
jgi:hypothetical protein